MLQSARAEYPQSESAALHLRWIAARLENGQILTFDRPEDLPDSVDRDALRQFGVVSGVAIPFASNGELTAVLDVCSLGVERSLTPDLVERLALLATIFSQGMLRREMDDRLRSALVEVRQLREQLAIEEVELRREVAPRRREWSVVAESPATCHVLEQIEAVAATDATVLLTGETGTGKEVFARALHQASARRGRPMIVVNCGAIPSALIESELCGRETGAYTGALARQIGRFEMAHDSTMFLDEIGELPLEAQVKLLRVMQERVIERLGSGHPIKVNVRIVAATNRDLEQAVDERTFREDLYYRLNVFPIRIPPLRERLEDIPALVWSFVEEYAAAFRKRVDSISKESLAALQQYPWPGNVRELRNVVERALIVANGPRLVIDLPRPANGISRKITRLDDLEAAQIRQIMEQVKWRVRGAGGAAELLGIKPNTLDSRMVKLGIHRPDAAARGPRRGESAPK
jgi:transcriptional regulator with GAF, ATPase, and Fis domain